MVRYLLSDTDEGLFILSERFSQDPRLENYFGKQRARGGRCDNPTLNDCLKSAVSSRKRLLEEPIEVDCTPLPKRLRCSKKKKNSVYVCIIMLEYT